MNSVLGGLAKGLGSSRNAADMQADLKAQKTRSWDDVTLGDLVGRIVADHGLQPSVDSVLRTARIPHLDQAEESDLHLLARLAQDRDAVAKQVGDFQLFVSHGESSSATDKPIPAVDHRSEDFRRWRVTIADRDAHGSVRAHWHEPATGRRRTETVGSGNPARTPRRIYASAPEAAGAARAELARLARGTVRLSV